MRLALLSDIHGNIQALEACLQHARAQQVQAFAVLGDLVGYGANPAQVVDPNARSAPCRNLSTRNLS